MGELGSGCRRTEWVSVLFGDETGVYYTSDLHVFRHYGVPHMNRLPSAVDYLFKKWETGVESVSNILPRKFPDYRVLIP